MKNAIIVLNSSNNLLDHLMLTLERSSLHLRTLHLQAARKKVPLLLIALLYDLEKLKDVRLTHEEGAKDNHVRLLNKYQGQEAGYLKVLWIWKLCCRIPFLKFVTDKGIYIDRFSYKGISIDGLSSLSIKMEGESEEWRRKDTHHD